MTEAEVNQQLLDQIYEIHCIVIEERTSKQQLDDRMRLILHGQTHTEARGCQGIGKLDLFRGEQRLV